MLLATSVSRWLLIHVDARLLFAGIVVITMALSILAVAGARRRWPHFADGVNNTVGSVLMAMIGTVYAVVVGFVVVTLWTTFERAEETTHQEAGALLDVYRQNTALSFRVASDTQVAVRDYARLVIDEEWPAMAHGGSSRRAERAALRIFDVFREYEPVGGADSMLLSESNARYNDFLEARRSRLTLAGAGLPGVFWAAILLGAVVTIGFTVFFGQPSAIAQMAMTGALAASVGLMLALILLLNHPFAGELSVSPQPFQSVLDAG